MNDFVLRIETTWSADGKIDSEVHYEEYETLHAAECRARILREYGFEPKVEIYRLL